MHKILATMCFPILKLLMRIKAPIAGPHAAPATARQAAWLAQTAGVLASAPAQAPRQRGENCGLLLRGTRREDVERGQVVCKPGSNKKAVPTLPKQSLRKILRNQVLNSR